MPVMVRVGAVHLGWDVVSVAAGGSGVPIRPVQVEGSYNPPAYLLADASGRLYTAGAARQRPELGMAIPDVREILGHQQIIIAGATWPAELVFRARLYHPLAAVGSHLRGKPDLIALPYPDDWPDPKIDAYAQLVEQLDVEVEPIPESIALSGYVRALSLVRPPDARAPGGVGAVAVHFDGQVVDGRANMLVVAVHGDEERPTESVYVPIDPESTHDPRVADDTVIEVMAAARGMGADNSTVLLAGQMVFNETLRFAFRNHLGQRLKKAEHPMHALVLGATHLLVTENEDEGDEPGPGYPPPGPPSPGPEAPRPGGPVPDPRGGGSAPPPPGPSAGPRPTSGPNHPMPGYQPPSGRHAQRPDGSPARDGGSGPPHGPGPDTSASGQLRGGPPAGAAGSGGVSPAEVAGSAPGNVPQRLPAPGATVVGRGDLAPPISANRFTQPPDPETGSQSAVPRQPEVGAAGVDQPEGGQAVGSAPDSSDPDAEKPKGKLWNKMKDNLFGAHAVVGVLALAVAVGVGAGVSPALAAAQPAPASFERVGCTPIPRVLPEPDADAGSGARQGQRSAGSPQGEACGPADVDNLRYLVPEAPGVLDPGPPVDIRGRAR